jgi:hypothetical protein
MKADQTSMLNQSVQEKSNVTITKEDFVVLRESPEVQQRQQTT